MFLEIGGGTIPTPGWENLDIHHPSRPDLQVKVQDGIPLPDNSVQGARASHVLEHIPKHDDQLLNAMNEIHRVLVPGGQFEIIVPCMGYTNHEVDGAPVYAGWQAHADMGHCSYWWYPESFWYFTGRYGANADYGVRYWNEVSTELRSGWEARVVLSKPQ